MATGSREWSCPICCEVPRDIAHALPCRHQFCLGCIVRWLRGRRTCPLCRRLISTVSLLEHMEDLVHIIIWPPERARRRAENDRSDGSGTRGPVSPSASQGTPSPSEQGTAWPEATGGILPELWAELFRRRQALLSPVRAWLRQRLPKIFPERWWLVNTAESCILLALCTFGPDREVLVRQLQPLLRQYTRPVVRGILSIIETRCSREVWRLRRCHGALEEAEGPAACPGPAARPGDAAASAGDEATRGSPSTSAPVPAETQQP